MRPNRQEWEAKSVFNPGIFQNGNDVHIIYRALDKHNISSLGYARSDGPLKVVERWKEPFLTPKFKSEKCGIEDARVVKIDGLYFLTYVVHDGENALVAYSYGKDLFHLKRGGVISPNFTYDYASKFFDDTKLNDKYFFFKSYYKDTVKKNVKLWDKDSFLFPEKINGKYALVHRVLPDIQVAYFDDFKQLKRNGFWKENIKNLSEYVIIESRHGFESRNIGGGCPPVKTKAGWLFIYHAVEPLNKGRVYHAAAALLNLENPTKVIARLPYPLFSPTEKYEKRGFVHNVVFPTGTALFDGRLYIYYGASDKYAAAASVDLDELIKELLKYREK